MMIVYNIADNTGSSDCPAFAGLMLDQWTIFKQATMIPRHKTRQNLHFYQQL